MFYAAQALLKAEGINVVKHSAVESAFGYYFAKTERVDVKYHRMSRISHIPYKMAQYR